MEELQNLVRSLEGESKSLHDKISSSEIEISKLQELLSASEEKCSLLTDEKVDLTQVWLYTSLFSTQYLFSKSLCAV